MTRPIPLYEIKEFLLDVWHVLLKPRRRPRPERQETEVEVQAQETPPSSPTAATTSLSGLKPSGMVVTRDEILAEKERIRLHERERALRARAARQPPPMVEAAYECTDLYGDLRILAPADGVTPKVTEFYTLEPCHPHWDKRMVTAVVRRGKREYRLLLYLADAVRPIVHDRDVQELGALRDFFKSGELVAIAQGCPLKLAEWKGDEADE